MSAVKYSKASRTAVKENLKKNLLGYPIDNIDSNISIKQSNTINMDKNESNTSKDNLFVRININILKENYEFLKEYKEKSGVPPASKCSELLNRAISELRKQSI